MTQRYYVEPEKIGSSAALTDAEAHHFLHVMRGSVDDRIVLFDGAGYEYHALVTAVSRREVELQILDHRSQPLDLPVRLDMAVSLPKGDRGRWLVEKLTELGVASLTPLAAQRANPQPSGGGLEKLRRYSIEACKQSGRNRLLEVTEACSTEAFDRQLNEQPGSAERLRLVAHPGGEASAAGPQVAAAVESRRPIAVVIGPEGGLTEEEVAWLVSHGWQPVTLGPRILRIETAAVAVAALAALQA